MKMKKIKGGTFMMGTNSEEGFLDDFEGPQVAVSVKDFSIADTPVTNQEFAQFVKETGYKTLAERQEWSFVFILFVPEAEREGYPHPAGAPWWLQVSNACWKHPYGENSNLVGLEDHPVVHVALEDALAFCNWSGMSLPTEAQWEYAARGGRQSEYPWGDTLLEGGYYHANTWQGRFPYENTALDGFIGTAPVYEFLPNDFGLYQMIGNVWEWCRNPRYTLLASFNEDDYELPKYGIQDEEYAIRGGSFLCHLDSFGYHSVSDIAFYSSFSVFIMAIISTTKRFSQSKEIKWRLIFTVSFSSVLGGFLGHLIFQVLLSQLSVRLVSIVQMILLFVMLLVSFVLTDFKKTYQFDKIGFYMICGLLLGLISSFLGIGGGPLNVSLLMVFFSISIKEATMYSLAIIFFSQLSHLATIVVVTGLNQYHLAPVPVIFLASICGGVLGTVVSKVLPENWVRYCFKGMLFFVMGMTLYNLFHIL